MNFTFFFFSCSVYFMIIVMSLLWVWNKVATVALAIRFEHKNIVDVYLNWKNERVWTRKKKWFSKEFTTMMMKKKRNWFEFLLLLVTFNWICAQWILLNLICKYKLIHSIENILQNIHWFCVCLSLLVLRSIYSSKIDLFLLFFYLFQ